MVIGLGPDSIVLRRVQKGPSKGPMWILEQTYYIFIAVHMYWQLKKVTKNVP